jgi:hypothetical protein
VRGREFFVTNRWQKLFALSLAILIWLAVHSGVTPAPEGITGHLPREFPDVPIMVLTPATDLGHYRLQPKSVRVLLRGDPAVLKLINARAIEAFVSLAEDSPMGARPIHVYPPAGTALISVEPDEVLVERLSGTNSPPSHP